MSTSTWRCAGSVTPYVSSIWLRYADLVGALPVSMRDKVDGATPSCVATSSSLYPLDSRSLRNSVPSRRLRTVGPAAIRGLLAPLGGGTGMVRPLENYRATRSR